MKIYTKIYTRILKYLLRKTKLNPFLWIDEDFILSNCKANINHYYLKIRRRDLTIINEKLIKVHKGKARYKLLILETRDGKIKYMLSRHTNEHLISSKQT